MPLSDEQNERLKALCKSDSAYAEALEIFEKYSNSQEQNYNDAFDVTVDSLYHYLFEHSHAVKLWIEPQTMRILEANTAASEFYGYTREQLCAMTVIDISALSHEELRQRMQAVMKLGSATFEVPHRTASGEVRAVLAYVTRVHWRDKRFIDATILDVSEVRIARETLAASERFARQIALAIPDFVFVYDVRSQHYQFVNQHIAVALGYADDLIMPDTIPAFENLLHPDDARALYEHFYDMMFAPENEVHELQCRLVHKDGTDRWFVFRTTAFEVNEQHVVCRFLCLAHDITTRRHNEDALRRSEARYRLFARGLSNIGVIIFDRDMRYLLTEGDLLIKTGYQPTKMEGHTIDEVISEALLASIKPLYERALRGEEFQTQVEEHGGVYASHFMPLSDDSDAVYAVMVVIQDVTEFSHAEERRMRLKLREKQIKMLAEFITGAFHQFGTPLAIIASSVDLMRRTQGTESFERHAQKIVAQVNGINKLVHMLTLMARLDADDQIESMPCYLNSIVEGAALSLHTTAQQKAVKLTLNIPDTPLRYLGDALYLHEAFMQLIDNAVRYTPEGGAVDIHLYESAESYHVAIRDSGIGISEEHAPHLFERFYRGDAAQTTSGFGLGLPIAAKIIQLHSGTLMFESIPQHGSTFTVTLPRR